MTQHLMKYVNYINNTGQKPLAVSVFDEDWEPIGEMVRKDMVAAELIQIREDGIHLRPDLWEDQP